MDAEYTLRAAEIADSEAILVVHVAAIIEHGPAAYTDKQVAAWAAKTDGVDRYKDAVRETELIVAEHESRLVGFGELDIESGEVVAVFVSPEYGRQGIGSSLLAHCEQRLRDEGVETARLRAVLNAVEFYRHHGYEKTTREPYTTTNGVEADAVWMTKSL